MPPSYQPELSTTPNLPAHSPEAAAITKQLVTVQARLKEKQQIADGLKNHIQYLESGQLRYHPQTENEVHATVPGLVGTWECVLGEIEHLEQQSCALKDEHNRLLGKPRVGDLDYRLRSAMLKEQIKAELDRRRKRLQERMLTMILHPPAIPETESKEPVVKRRSGQGSKSAATLGLTLKPIPLPTRSNSTTQPVRLQDPYNRGNRVGCSIGTPIGLLQTRIAYSDAYVAWPGRYRGAMLMIPGCGGGLRSVR